MRNTQRTRLFWTAQSLLIIAALVSALATLNLAQARPQAQDDALLVPRAEPYLLDFSNETIRNEWRPLQGSWQFTPPEYLQTESSVAPAVSLYSKGIESSYRLEASMRRVEEGMGAGVIFGAVGPETLPGSYGARFNSGGATLEWGRFDRQSNFQVQGSVGGLQATDSAYHKLVVVVNDNGFDLFVDDIGVAAGLTIDAGPRSYVGLYANLAHIAFQNVTVTVDLAPSDQDTPTATATELNPVETPTPTVTEQPTEIATPTFTETVTPTETPSETPSPTPTTQNQFAPLEPNGQAYFIPVSVQGEIDANWSVVGAGDWFTVGDAPSGYKQNDVNAINSAAFHTHPINGDYDVTVRMRFDGRSVVPGGGILFNGASASSLTGAYALRYDDANLLTWGQYTSDSFFQELGRAPINPANYQHTTGQEFSLKVAVRNSGYTIYINNILVPNTDNTPFSDQFPARNQPYFGLHTTSAAIRFTSVAVNVIIRSGGSGSTATPDGSGTPGVANTFTPTFTPTGTATPTVDPNAMQPSDSEYDLGLSDPGRIGGEWRPLGGTWSAHADGQGYLQTNVATANASAFYLRRVNGDYTYRVQFELTEFGAFPWAGLIFNAPTLGSNNGAYVVRFDGNGTVQWGHFDNIAQFQLVGQQSVSAENVVTVEVSVTSNRYTLRVNGSPLETAQGIEFIPQYQRNVQPHIGLYSTDAAARFADARLKISPRIDATPTPTLSPTPTWTLSPTWTPTKTRTPIPTGTATQTRTPTLTFTPTNTLAPTASLEPTPTITETFTPEISAPTPLPTPIPTQTPISAEDLTATAVALLPTATLTPSITPTPVPTNTLPPTASATATETPTITPTQQTVATVVVTLTATATQRVQELPALAPSDNNPTGAVGEMFDSIVTAAGFIWFMVGTIVFFAVAGTIAGLSFRQQSEERYELALDPSQRRPAASDEWGALDVWSDRSQLPPVPRQLPDYGAPSPSADTSITPLPKAYDEDDDNFDDDFDDWPLSLP